MEYLPRLDPDAELARAMHLLGFASDLRRGAATEVYLRSTVRRRAALGEADPRSERDGGLERGVAVRVGGPAEGETGFAAASGAGDEDARWAFAAAARSGFRPGAPIAGSETPIAPHDRAELELPTAEELRDWISGVQGHLDRGAGPSGARLTVKWVEAGSTVESLATGQGFRSSRARRRVWAMAMARWPRQVSAPGRARVLAGTSLDELAWEIWVEEQRRVATGDRVGSRASPGPIVLEPAAAAVVVDFLARTLHGKGAVPSAPVGPGWKLVDDPCAPGSAAGGAFDDAGFPAGRVELADGRTVRGVLTGRGHYRRPSYRDYPEPMPSHLVVEGGGEDVPADADFVRDVRIIPLEAERYVLWVDGERRRGGVPVGAFVGGRIRTEPRDLVRRITRAAGPAARAAAGVTTPHLVLEGLTLES